MNLSILWQQLQETEMPIARACAGTPGKGYPISSNVPRHPAQVAHLASNLLPNHAVLLDERWLLPSLEGCLII